MNLFGNVLWESRTARSEKFCCRLSAMLLTLPLLGTHH